MDPGPGDALPRGAYYWHEMIGVAVRDPDGAELGAVRDIYRVGSTDILEVVGGPRGDFDLPLARPFVRILAPRRGEIVADPETLDLPPPGAARPASPPRPPRPRRATRRRPAVPMAPAPGAGRSCGPRGWRPGAGQRAPTPRRTPRPDPWRSRSRSSPSSRRCSAGPLAASIPGRIQEDGLAAVRVHDLRTWGLGRHRSVDDAPYGGGAGMVLRPEPVAGALAALRRPGSTVILLDPAGEPFRQARAEDLATRAHLVLLCPRYEGVDERIRALVDLELSIGDYVLTGGELAALVVVDAVLRLLPGAIDEASLEDESFSNGLLEYPQYTRPAVFEGRGVPDILVSGDHAAVRRWRLRESIRRTLERRPDLLPQRPWSAEEERLLEEVRADAEPGQPRRGGRPRPATRRLATDAREGRAILRRRSRPRGLLLTPSTRHAESPGRSQTAQGTPVNVLDEIVKDQLRSDIPELAPGDTVKVAAKVVEGNRERIQVFEGTVLRLTGGGITRSVTVRRIASGVGVERTFKVNSPRIERIEVVRHGVARRAKLYFLRKRVGKAATLRERRTS